jgi:hypothetical protein
MSQHTFLTMVAGFTTENSGMHTTPERFECEAMIPTYIVVNGEIFLVLTTHESCTVLGPDFCGKCDLNDETLAFRTLVRFGRHYGFFLCV